MADAVITRLEALGRQGFVVSIAYGPLGSDGLSYSVDVLAPDGSSFDLPYTARDFAHAVEIAEAEIAARGWRPH